ncbi:MAG: hypothetical protein ACYTEZ_17460 [Planctomycetota bacterium]|jgi:hypothetical protein
MRFLVIWALLGAACGAGGKAGSSRVAIPTAKEQLRVVYNSYRKGSTVLVMENLAGRDLVKLRSRKLAATESPVAYVPDDVMAKMLAEFKRYGFHRYAQSRPPNPVKYGAVGEITLISADRTRMVSLLRTKRRAGDTATDRYVAVNQSYVDCANTFIAVYNHFRPQLQATTSTGDPFGVRRVER